MRAVFAALSRSDWDAAMADLADDVVHVFPGENPLGGRRHSRAAVGVWFARLERLFPGHHFDVTQVISHGWPWSSTVAVRWTATLAPRAGEPYLQHGTHWLHIRWGQVTAFHAYLDTERLARACAAMVAAGIAEAGAEFIADANAEAR
jgi:ketosteroid isomerase-like protein